MSTRSKLGKFLHYTHPVYGWLSVILLFVLLPRADQVLAGVTLAMNIFVLFMYLMTQTGEDRGSRPVLISLIGFAAGTTTSAASTLWVFHSNVDTTLITGMGFVIGFMLIIWSLYQLKKPQTFRD